MHDNEPGLSIEGAPSQLSIEGTLSPGRFTTFDDVASLLRPESLSEAAERISRAPNAAPESSDLLTEEWSPITHWGNRRPTVINSMRPYQDTYNIAINNAYRQAVEARVHPRAPVGQAIYDAEDAELEALAQQADQFEQRERKKRKKMEATKEKKSVYKHRFTDAPWFEWLKNKEVLLLGAGGIGSWVALALCRVGCALHIYDMDTIEPHNLGGQFYHINNVGGNKAESVAQLAHMFSGNESNISTHGLFDDDAPIGPIVISAFDNMAARALAFAKWSEALAADPDNAKDYLFIDGRLLAEDYQVYAVTPGRVAAYKETLFTDGEVADAQCSLKATTHCSMGIASEIVGVLANFATNQSYGTDIREVPFSIIKSMPLFMYDLKLEVGEQQKENGETEPVPAI